MERETEGKIRYKGGKSEGIEEEGGKKIITEDMNGEKIYRPCSGRNEFVERGNRKEKKEKRDIVFGVVCLLQKDVHVTLSLTRITFVPASSVTAIA